MAEPLFLGIDGGGTSCRARLRNAAGKLLGEGMGGAANARLDPALVRQSILDAASAARAQAGLDEDAIWKRTYAGWGLAGAGQPVARTRLLAQEFPFATISLDTDAYTAWLGATAAEHADNRGAILIVGTGVCGFMEREEQRISIGGWGSIVSDDGSGAVTGREIIRRTLKVYDGLFPASPLTEAILAAIGPSVEAIVEWADTAKPADFARFAPLAYAHAAQDDPNARDIVEQAAHAISELTLRLVTLGAPRVHMLGGLAQTIQPWLSPAAQSCFAPPHADALDGAIVMAQRNFASAGHGNGDAA
ncbi:BadF/BadG/BcrA/BcrD ATPase family protein [Pseudochelatococcus sp. G4_1912]|uniref:BadF/BadG/BcrA/BcrD ATPase family protein n=1 Tax=Pseudochelatococcus sp. G4_1912 TaxID=3114288 RepID=UPI0039C70AE0